MESGRHHREEARSSGEETGRPEEEEEEDEDMITGPSYDCVFCKRGFTTAQALGGHMNIHRKDRAKAKPLSSTLVIQKKPEENYMNSGFCLSILSYKPPNSTASEAQIKYQEYILASTSPPPPPPPPAKELIEKKNQQITHVCKDDWRTCLSLQVGPSCEHDCKEKGKDEKKEDELDLELRLGHNPSS